MQPGFLSSEQLQLFVAGLAGLPKDEVRKAKLLYIKNAISEYRAARSSIAGFQGRRVASPSCPSFGR